MGLFRPRLTPNSYQPSEPAGDRLATARGLLVGMALSAGFWIGLGWALRGLPG